MNNSKINSAKIQKKFSGIEPPKLIKSYNINDFYIISFKMTGKSICSLRIVSIFSFPMEVREKNI